MAAKFGRKKREIGRSPGRAASHVCFPGFDQIGRPPRISPLVDRKMAGWGLSDQSMDLTKTNYLEGAAMPWPTSLSTRALPWSNALPPPPPRSQSTPPFQGPAQMRTSQNPNPKTQLRLGMSLENSKYWRAESNESQFEVEREDKRSSGKLYDVSAHYPDAKNLGRRNFHMPATDINRYANDFTRHYPPELYDVAGNRKPNHLCTTRA